MTNAHRAWIWYGVAFLLGSFLVFNALNILALARVQPPRPRLHVSDAAQLARIRAMSIDLLNSMEAARRGAQGAAQGGAAPANGEVGYLKAVVAVQRVRPDDPVSGSANACSRYEVGARAGGAAGATLASVLPFTPITLVFQDLHYTVPNPGYKGGGCCGGGGDVEAPVSRTLELLKGITGEALLTILLVFATLCGVYAT